jgi:hypothetical protein
MERRSWIIAVAFAGLLTGATAYYVLNHGSDFPSPSCASLSVSWNGLARQQGGYSYLCGLGSVSDGRLAITLNNYRFVDGSTIDWRCPGTSLNGSSCLSSGVYLIANVTVDNVGKGNTSMGPSLYFDANNSAGQSIANGEYGADAVFPGLSPNASIPAVGGGVHLPPGASVTYWYIFYAPKVAVSDVHDLTLHWLSYAEVEYGGTWNGYGNSCVPVPCQDPMTELIVVAP